jgi:hypothetical protein
MGLNVDGNGASYMNLVGIPRLAMDTTSHLHQS